MNDMCIVVTHADLTTLTVKKKKKFDLNLHQLVSNHNSLKSPLTKEKRFPPSWLCPNSKTRYRLVMLAPHQPTTSFDATTEGKLLLLSHFEPIGKWGFHLIYCLLYVCLLS